MNEINFQFEGQVDGITDLLPKVVGDYNTNNYGQCFNFEISRLKVGEIFEEKGLKYKVIRNEISLQGCAAFPTVYRFQADLENTSNNILQLQKEVAELKETIRKRNCLIKSLRKGT